MAGFVSKQPNGLYCRFSTVTDCPTAWNMTREDYINMKMQEAKEDAEDVLDNYLKPFDMVVAICQYQTICKLRTPIKQTYNLHTIYILNSVCYWRV